MRMTLLRRHHHPPRVATFETTLMPEEPPVLVTDIPFEKSLVWSPWETATQLAVAVCFVIAYIVALETLPPSAPNAAASRVACYGGALLVTLFFVHARRAWARSRARVLARAAAHQDLPSTAAMVVNDLRGYGGIAALVEAVKTWAETGQQGALIRIGKPSDMEPVQPFAHPFEPQPLNEAFSPLIAGRPRSEGRGAPTPDAPRIDQGPGALELPRSVRRNITLRGGWWMLALFATCWACAVYEAIYRRQFTWFLAACSLGLWAMLFLPFEIVRFNQQWFVTPGGLILRQAGWRQGSWGVHLFERRASVLCVCRQHHKQWGVFVADRETGAHTVATRDEVQFLLRAWLSPIPPAPADRLTDLQ